MITSEEYDERTCVVIGRKEQDLHVLIPKQNYILGNHVTVRHSIPFLDIASQICFAPRQGSTLKWTSQLLFEVLYWSLRGLCEIIRLVRLVTRPLFSSRSTLTQPVCRQTFVWLRECKAWPHLLSISGKPGCTRWILKNCLQKKPMCQAEVQTRLHSKKEASQLDLWSKPKTKPISPANSWLNTLQLLHLHKTFAFLNLIVEKHARVPQQIDSGSSVIDRCIEK